MHSKTHWNVVNQNECFGLILMPFFGDTSMLILRLRIVSFCYNCQYDVMKNDIVSVGESCGAKAILALDYYTFVDLLPKVLAL